MTWRERIGAFFGRPVVVEAELATPAAAPQPSNRGRAPMSRDEMLAILGSLTLDDEIVDQVGDKTDVQAWMEAQQKWLDVAREDWIDIVLGLAADPPPDKRREEWEWAALRFLEGLAYKFPQAALDKIAARLPSQNRGLRPFLICGLGAITLLQAQELLQPFVDDIERLPLAELAQLAEAIEPDDRREYIQILRRIRAAIPPTEDAAHDEVREDVEFSLSYEEERLESADD